MNPVLHVILMAVLLTLVFVPHVDRSSSLEMIASNAVPVCVLGLLLLFLSGRPVTTIGVILLVLAAFELINARKSEILALPLSYNDTLMLGEFAKSPGLLLQYGSRVEILLVLLGIVAVLLLFRFEHPVFSRRRRLFGTFVVGAALVALALPVSPALAYYKTLPLTPWAPSQSFERKGLIASLLQEYAIVASLKTPRADKRVLASYRTQYPLLSPPAAGEKPDVIIWLSESYFDPRILRHIDDCRLIPDFCRLAEDYQSGTLVVPTYAGQTVRTEFEVLTGIPIAVLDGHAYPYLSLVNKPINSIAWQLKNLGYATHAVHTHKRAFWRRNIALPYLGFDSWTGLEDINAVKRSGYYAADSFLTDEVARRLSAADVAGAPPQLIFAISMEAHGPWGDQPGLPEEELASLAVPEPLAESAADEFRQYFYHLRNADVELARMVDLINQRERPTVMLFFGDHLPGLAKVYQSLRFKNGKGPREQDTNYLLAANEAAQTVLGEVQFPQRMATWQMSAYLLDSLGLAGTSQFAWFDRLYDSAAIEDMRRNDCETESCQVLRQLQLEQLDLL